MSYHHSGIVKNCENLHIERLQGKTITLTDPAPVPRNQTLISPEPAGAIIKAELNEQ